MCKDDSVDSVVGFWGKVRGGLDAGVCLGAMGTVGACGLVGYR